MTEQLTVARCACGKAGIQATGDYIFTLVCYCDDCQTGSGRAEALPGARPVLDAHGGTFYALFRKDRLKITSGSELFEPFKLRDSSPLRRHVATCCNSVLFLDFDNWYPWVSVYAPAIVGAPPPLQMRLFTKFAPAPDMIPDDVPAYRTWPLKFPAKMMLANIAMRLGL